MTPRTKTFDAEAFIKRLDAMDVVLVQHGFHDASPWWRKERARFIRALKGRRDERGRGAAVRRWVLRVGRRGGKSSMLARIAVAWALWGTWFVPTGDIAVVGFISKDRDEASARLRTIAAILDALGVAYEPRGDEIELVGKGVCFRVLTCTVAGVVGATLILLIGDEMAHWESREDRANPADRVMGASRPAMATQPWAFEIDSTAPWGADDYHSTLFNAGDNGTQIVSHAATWTANPSISEQDTHDLEQDPKLWSMNYAAIPGVTLTLAFDPADLVPCFGRAARGRLGAGFVATDASSLRGDAFAYIAGRVSTAGELVVDEVDGWDGDELRGVEMDEIVERISARAKDWGANEVFGDQREEASLRALFANEGVRFTSYAWTEQSKDDAVMRLRRLMREGMLCLVEHPTLRRELTTMKARLLPSGRTRYETNGLDFASALITLAHGIVAGRVEFESSEGGGLISISSGRDPQRVAGVYAGGHRRGRLQFFTDTDGIRKVRLPS